MSKNAPLKTATKKWESLLDKKLTQFEIFGGVPHGSLGLSGVPSDSDGIRGTPLGLNQDPLKVFSVVKENGEHVLRISGQMYSGLTTKKDYSNFHFRAQFKWGEKKWAPRTELIRDNGILYHCNGEHGAFWNVWKQCLEYQVQETDMADFIALAGTAADIPATFDGKEWVYDVNAKPFAEQNVQTKQSPRGRVAHKEGDYEKPHGEWNTLEIYTLGREAVHLVNGQVVLSLKDAVHKVNGVFMPLSSGQLQIQSEGAEAYYRRMEIAPITRIPDEVRLQMRRN